MNTAHKIALTCLLVSGCAVEMGADVSLDTFDRNPPDPSTVGTSANVTCDMTITGAQPVLYAGCSFKSPLGRKAGCLATSAVGNVWSCDLTLPANTENATWTLEYVFAQDTIGNKMFATGAELVADADNVLEGDPTRVDLDVQSPVQDVVPPVITDFAVYPSDPSPGDLVTCAISATDPDISSGIGISGCSFVPNDSSGSISCTSPGGLLCSMSIPLGTEGVTYAEINHFVRDKALNVTVASSGASIGVTGAGGAGGAAGAGGAGGVAGSAGAGGAGGAPACDFTPTYSASNGWYSPTTSVTAATDEVSFSFYARANASSQGAVVAFGPSATIAQFSDAAILIQFSTAGTIQVRDGANYCGETSSCDAPNTAGIPYTAGNWYHFVGIANLTTDTYTVSVENCDDGLVAIKTDAAFRSDSCSSGDCTTLGYHTAWSSQAAAVDVYGVIWTPGDCVATETCITEGYECGTPLDDCGVPLASCGTCTGPDVCFPAADGMCCTPGLQAAICAAPDPDYECGDWSDGCGGTVNCGTCGGGTPFCDAGTCVAQDVEPENTQGDTWETIYEACTGDDYPTGYQPPKFVRPTRSNTGANCTDASCPNGGTPVTLTEYAGPNPITTPGVYENFYIDNGQRLEIRGTDGVTLRNFEIRCTPGQNHGVYIDNEGTSWDTTNTLIEYGTIKPGTGPCARGIQSGWSGNIHIRHVWIDMFEADGVQNANDFGPTLLERSLMTRGGANGGQGGGGDSEHADGWQFRVPQSNTSVCMLGTRIVPVYKTTITTQYVEGCFKQSNVTQNGPDGSGKWYIYNNWIDGSTNNAIAGDGLQVRNNRFGNFFQLSAYAGWPGSDLGGNVWECDGSSITSPNNPPDCEWGFTGWRNENLDPWPPLCTDITGTGGNRICEPGGEDCYPTFDDAPIDPTEFGWPPP